MNKQKSQQGSGLLAIVIILAVVLIGAVGYIFWQNFFSGSNKSENISSQFKTYTNDKYSYQFQYPSDWSTSSESDDAIVEVYDPILRESQISLPNYSDALSGVVISYCNLDKAVKDNCYGVYGDDIDLASYVSKRSPLSRSVEINGLTAYEYITAGSYYNFTRLVEYKGGIYSFSAVSETYNLDGLSGDIKSILSSISFN